MTIPLEEAAKCPKCSKPGKLDGARALEDGGHLNVYLCDNNRCVWLNTGWVVQTDKRGMVYERPIGDRGHDKSFPVMSNQVLSAGQRTVEDAVRRDLRPNTKEQ
jgi:hypothetical protein